MAVEMAKLSLWLTTMSRERPFTFVDHAIRAGDSLLGLTSLDQVTAFHMDPARGRDLHKDLFLDLHATLKPLVEEVLELRRDLTHLPVVTVRDVERKQALNERAEHLLATAAVIADTLVGAALCSGGNDRRLDDLLVVARPLVVAAVRDPDTLGDLRAHAEEMLNRGRPDAAPLRRPLHWALAFPDVMRAGVFDAMVGNPPFQGGSKISGLNGADYREYLTRWVADDRKGNADLVTFFFLRAATTGHAFGFIATNTIAQGDTRKVGLDHIVGTCRTIPIATRSRPWPGAANLEIAQVWATDAPWGGEVVLDGKVVTGIAPTLDPVGRVTGPPRRLATNAGIATEGSKTAGTGFMMSPEDARAAIRADERNRDVLHPYLSGIDLNSSPASQGSRWVVCFWDWPLDRAQNYALPFEHTTKHVRPGREAGREELKATWWRYERPRMDLYLAIAEISKVCAIAVTSSVVQAVRVDARQVFANTVVVFTSDSWALLALLCSAVHGEWVRKHASSMRTDTRYTPSDVFETFPFPAGMDSLEAPGKGMEAARNAVMQGRWIGLTKTYNLVNDPDSTDADVQALRDAHIALDMAVLAAYGWDDLDPRHGFYDTAQGRRFTIHPEVRDEVLDRLLELNHARYAEEVAAGLHAKGARKKATKKPAPKPAPPDAQLTIL